MIPGLIILAAALGLAFNNVQPHLKTPEELSKFTKCDPDKIAFFVAQKDYEIMPTWEPSTVCMTEPKYDCKCAATIARDALKVCERKPRIISVMQGAKHHAVTVYKRKDGRTGFIDWSRTGIVEDGIWEDRI